MIAPDQPAGSPPAPSLILAIETSCDETAAAVVTSGGHVLANEVFSQIAHHQAWGGVVPEIASRCHVEVLPRILDTAMTDAGVAWTDLEGIAVTRGPGLATSLLTGLASARALALRLNLPIAGTNHLDGHAASIRLHLDGPWQPVELPALILLVSGGHTLLVLEEAPGAYRVIGRTLDDAAGEALDKGAKLLGLGYPGGPILDAKSRTGDPRAFAFPRGLVRGGGSDELVGGLSRQLCFSFSGVKTSLMNHLRNHPDHAETRADDLCASYQEAVVDALVNRVDHALEHHACRTFACAGGVARNHRLRHKLRGVAESRGVVLRLAEPDFCTDNAAMIAAAAFLRGGWTTPADPSLDAAPNLRIGVG